VWDIEVFSSTWNETGRVADDCLIKAGSKGAREQGGEVDERSRRELMELEALKDMREIGGLFAGGGFFR
jgi:hypothetical protein